jgi:hypothetical protein
MSYIFFYIKEYWWINGVKLAMIEIKTFFYFSLNFFQAVITTLQKIKEKSNTKAK